MALRMPPRETRVLNVILYATLDLKPTWLLVTTDYKICAGPLNLQPSAPFPAVRWMELLQLGKSQGGHLVPDLKPGTTAKGGKKG